MTCIIEMSVQYRELVDYLAKGWRLCATWTGSMSSDAVRVWRYWGQDVRRSS